LGLFLIATPIGNPNDISIRGLAFLKSASVIILEERKEGAAFLRSHGITSAEKTYEQLNEHSTPDDLQRLLELCKTQDVALITDCGTPGFADPGADLVRLCRKNKVLAQSMPGASSLMTLLSLTGQRLEEFVFRGFLSAETTLRQEQWRALQSEKRAIVIMDTPYRFQKTCTELQQYFPTRKILLAGNMTQETEFIIETEGRSLSKELEGKPHKAEFMVLIYPQPTSKT
jgi:16S rRNA (cytidine1402-2'-O)-methyltransferase